mmetsp:Transcript_80249/g.208546  ORF Transcript_80249/g.208546 Transcript_80249/m.208546 type:complete len:256 (-) Transcript_80249:819-1586(-)
MSTQRLLDRCGEGLRLLCPIMGDEQIEELVVAFCLLGVFDLIHDVLVVHARVPVTIHGAHLLRDEEVVVVEGGEGDVRLQRQARVIHHRETTPGEHLIVLATQALGHNAVDLCELGPSNQSLLFRIVELEQRLDRRLDISWQIALLVCKLRVVDLTRAILRNSKSKAVFVLEPEALAAHAGQRCLGSRRLAVVCLHRTRLEYRHQHACNHFWHVGKTHRALKTCDENLVLTLLKLFFDVRAAREVMHQQDVAFIL